MITPDGRRVTPETHGLLVPMHVVATKVLQTGRETVDSEPVEDEEMDWRDVLDEGGIGDPASTEMRHQIFSPVDDTVGDDNLCVAVRQIGVPRVAKIGRVNERPIYRFLDGSVREREDAEKDRERATQTQHRVN